jgi:hypothetical protein
MSEYGIICPMIETWGIGYEQAKIRAKQIYSKIGRVSCPFFNGELVVFNRKGFNHLLRRGPKVRPKKDSLIRLRLIEFAESIIKNLDGNVVVEFRDDYEVERLVNRSGNKVKEKVLAKSWGFITTIDNSEITLVIGQIHGGQKEFLSIMAKKSSIHPSDI